MSHSDSEADPLVDLAQEFADRYRRGERPSLSEYAGRYPEHAERIRQIFPAMVAMERLGSAERVVGRHAGRSTRRGADPAARAAGRIPHPPRDRPGRDGRRLRGRAGVAGPPRRAEGPALPSAGRARTSSSDSAARPGPPPDCTTRTSCRCSAWASPTASTTTRCSTSRGRTWRSCCRRSGGCAGSRPSRGDAETRRSGLSDEPGPGAALGRPGSRRRPPSRRARAEMPGAAASAAADGRARRSSRPAASGERLGAGGPVGPPVRPERGADRPAGRRGAGLCPSAGRPASGHQAGEYPARHPGDGLGHRLRAGQGGRLGGADQPGRHRRHAAVHGPGAVRRPGRPPQRRLRAGPDALRDADAAPGVRVERPGPADGADPARSSRPGRGGSTRGSRATWRRSS